MSGRHPHGAGIVRKAHFGAPHELRAVLVGEAGNDTEGRLIFGVPSAVVGDELVTGAALIRCPKVPGIRTNCPDDSNRTLARESAEDASQNDSAAGGTSWPSHPRIRTAAARQPNAALVPRHYFSSTPH